MIVCLNGKFVHEHEAKISVFDRGFLYGDGVFETVPAAHGKIFWLEEHTERLLNSCEKLNIIPLWTREQIMKFVQETFDKNHKTDFEKLKVVLSRGLSNNPANIENISPCKPNLVIYCTENIFPAKKFLEQGIKLMTTHQGRPYPKIKTLSYVPSVLGTILAKRQGFDDALFIDHDSHVLEGTSFNVFEVMRGNVKVFNSYQNEVQNIVSSIGSGYQRDLQLTKKPFVQGVNLCLSTVTLLIEIVKSLQINSNNIEKAMTNDLYVTNEVYELAKKGKSFREAYIEIKKKWYKEE